MQFGKWITGAIVSAGLLAGSPAFAQEKLTVWWVKGFYKSEDDALFAAIKKFEAKQVIVVEPTGAETELLVQVGDMQIVVVIHGRTAARPDETVHLVIDTDKAHVFDSASGKRLG